MDKESILKFFGIGISLSIPDTDDPDGWLYILPIEKIPNKDTKICIKKNNEDNGNRGMKNSMVIGGKDDIIDNDQFEDYDKELLSDCVNGPSKCFQEFDLSKWEKKNEVEYEEMVFDLDNDFSEPVIITNKIKEPILSYPYIKAKWLRLGWDINRITPYHITRGEQVLLFRYGSSTEFFWLPMILPYKTELTNTNDNKTESIYSYTNINKRVSEDVRYEFNKVENISDKLILEKYKFYISPKNDKILIEHNTPSSDENKIGNWKLEMTPTNTFIGEKSSTSFTRYKKKDIESYCDNEIFMQSKTWKVKTEKKAIFSIGTKYSINVGANYDLIINEKGNIKANNGISIDGGVSIDETASVIRMNCGGSLNITEETIGNIKRNATKINKVKSEALINELKNDISEKYELGQNSEVIEKETGKELMDKDREAIYRTILKGEIPEDMDPGNFLEKTKELGLNNKYNPIPTDEKELIDSLINNPNSLLYGEGSDISEEDVTTIINNGSLKGNQELDSGDYLINYIKQKANLKDEEINTLIKVRSKGIENLTDEEKDTYNSGLTKLKNMAIEFLKKELGYETVNDIVSKSNINYNADYDKNQAYIEDFFLGINIKDTIRTSRAFSDYKPRQNIEKAVRAVIIGAGYSSLTGLSVKINNKLTESEANIYKEYLQNETIDENRLKELFENDNIDEVKSIDIRELFPNIVIYENNE